MSYTLLSTEPARDYEQFVLECMDNLREYRVRGIAIAAVIVEPEQGEEITMTGYWHLASPGKMRIAGEIQMDAIDDMILENIDRYRDYDQEEEED